MKNIFDDKLNTKPNINDILYKNTNPTQKLTPAMPSLIHNNKTNNVIAMLDNSKESLSPKQVQRKIGNTNKRRGHGRGCI